MSVRANHRPERGVELLLEQIQALDAPTSRHRPPPFDRLTTKVGPDFAAMLVRALVRDQGRRRPARVA
jgi:hypothetical protein